MYHVSASKLFTLLVIAGLFLGRGASLAVAEPEIPETVETSGVRFLTPETLTRIDTGLKWLSVRQNEDGAFGVRRGYGRNVAVVSLAGMAWLSSGSSPGRGPYGVNIQRATDFVLDSCRSSGFINVPEGQSHGPMYGHGFATLYLAEVYGMSPRKDIREKLEKAVRLIISCQNKEGGWRYENEPNEADVSVTVCQIMTRSTRTRTPNGFS
jgi:squalene cyclase